MELRWIVSMANRKVRLQFAAMERSLRATGCRLPMRVIPYDDDRFDLPAGAAWWEDREVTAWLAGHRAHAMMRKYQCLLDENYQFVDADVCFLRDPGNVLKDFQGWVASCTEWNKPQYICTDHGLHWLSARSSTWQKSCFSGGQFACDRPLFRSFEAMKETVTRSDMIRSCLLPPANDQNGLNLLVADSGVPFVNLTFPPHNMESTWAGDYLGEFQHLWNDPARKPYLIHWAGPAMEWERPVNRIFYDYLTASERVEWEAHMAVVRRQRERHYRSSLPFHRKVKYDLKRAWKWASARGGSGKRLPPRNAPTVAGVQT